jgi:hypothetical protein
MNDGKAKIAKIPKIASLYCKPPRGAGQPSGAAYSRAIRIVAQSVSEDRTHCLAYASGYYAGGIFLCPAAAVYSS